MKKIRLLFIAAIILFTQTACSSDEPPAENSLDSVDQNETLVQETSDVETDNISNAETEPLQPDGMEQNNSARQVSVSCGENVVVYELNEGSAANSLYEQLPLTLQVEDYSTNEKIFYPPQQLDTSDSPLAEGGAGTLAYYAPWGDVVMFYDEYSQNSSLFELGQVVSGGDLVEQMSGMITIEAVE